MEIIIYIMSNKNFYAGIKLSLIGNFVILQKEALLDLSWIEGVIKRN